MLHADEILAAGQSVPSLTRFPAGAGAEHFLRVPPFPGSSVSAFATLDVAVHAPDAASVVKALLRWRVGGTYWAAQPDLPASYVLVRSQAFIELAEQLYPQSKILLWEQGRTVPRVSAPFPVCTGDCDPWHMLSRARAVILEPGDELRPVAALLEIDRHIFDPLVGVAKLDQLDALDLVGHALSGMVFANPFTAEPMPVLEAIELCGFWRDLIDRNRGIAAGLGFAFWKQDHVAPLLWDGSGAFRFARNADALKTSSAVAVWRSKATAAVEVLERRAVPLVEVEDGFLRSRGLGADCIPPLSLVVDRLGAHFDPSTPSELERLLEETEFPAEIIVRAQKLRRLIIAAGIGKYGCATDVVERRAGSRRHILVPGQVEDDRAVKTGGCGLVSNRELLARVRQQAPDAYILYKPHPDVLAGHRRGAISTDSCLVFADEIVGELPIASLIAMSDEVHVNTSLAGFEALLRGKPVTTYGVPFYAGWGLTTDLGPVPSRRTARRSIDELVAATLLLYPRYLDPDTGLPCPAEVVVQRLSAGDGRDPGLVVGMRRLQGKLMRRLRSLVQ